METTSQKPLVVAFVSDLMFTTKINNVANHLNYRVRWVEDSSSFAVDGDDPRDEAIGEKLHGRQGQLFERIASWQPSLLLFDLANKAVPWREWIANLKISPATRRIPILAFGPHVDVDTLREAERIGADFVYPRSRFASAMPQIFQEHARIPEYDAINSACQEHLPALALSGIKAFNDGAYYACHDDLEEAWRQENGPGRDLYRGILQVAIAYYQIERGNYRGATKMLLRMRQWLSPLPAVCQGVNVQKLLQDATAVQEALSTLGPERIDEFDPSLFKPVEFQAE